MSELLMTAVDQKSLEHVLQSEGFVTTYVWQDGPGAKYPNHMHETETAQHYLGRRDDTHHGWTFADVSR